MTAYLFGAALAVVAFGGGYGLVAWWNRRRGDHWIARAEHVGAECDESRLLGEDDNGDLFVPSRTRREWWDRRFRWWNPLHWPYWLRSRLTLRVATLDAALAPSDPATDTGGEGHGDG